MPRKWLISGMFLLAGCAMDGGLHYAPYRYSDYQAMLRDTTSHILEQSKVADAPADVKQAYADCSAQFVWTRLPLDQQIKLDEYAKQQRGMTTAELQEADDTINQSGAPFTFDKLRPFCGDRVEQFKAAFHGDSPAVF